MRVRSFTQAYGKESACYTTGDYVLVHIHKNKQSVSLALPDLQLCNEVYGEEAQGH
jgi:hypothetical protein